MDIYQGWEDKRYDVVTDHILAAATKKNFVQIGVIELHCQTYHTTVKFPYGEISWGNNSRAFTAYHDGSLDCGDFLAWRMDVNKHGEIDFERENRLLTTKCDNVDKDLWTQVNKCTKKFDINPHLTVVDEHSLFLTMFHIHVASTIDEYYCPKKNSYLDRMLL